MSRFWQRFSRSRAGVLGAALHLAQSVELEFAA